MKEKKRERQRGGGEGLLVGDEVLPALYLPKELKPPRYTVTFPPKVKRFFFRFPGIRDLVWGEKKICPGNKVPLFPLCSGNKVRRELLCSGSEKYNYIINILFEIQAIQKRRSNRAKDVEKGEVDDEEDLPLSFPPFLPFALWGKLQKMKFI